MPSTIEQLASLIEGTILGQADLPIQAARTLQEAAPTDISFIETERNLRLLRECHAGALVVPQGIASRVPEYSPEGHQFTLIEAADPLLAFVRIVQHLQGPRQAPPAGIDPQARVHPTATLGEGCSIHPFAIIGEGAALGARCVVHSGANVGPNCRLGDDVVLHPGVAVYARTIIGHRVTIHANAVIGADGFGYRFQNGKHVKVPQLGHVEIGDDVEIGACTTIDRGTFQATRIGAGTKIDNLVMIAHNCRIGQHNLIVSQVGIAGSCTTGNYVVMAGQVGIADHLTINDRAVIGAGSGLHSDVPAGVRMLGYPAWPEREARRILVSLPNLPDLCKKVRQIEKQLGMKEAG